MIIISSAVLHEKLCVKNDQSIHHRHCKNADGCFITSTIDEQSKKYDVGDKT